jgi:dTDP-4-amino-4,6-dideoxygalactose transaminase
MTEIQAAIGRIQLRRMSDWHEKRRQNAKAILTVAREFSALQVPEVPHYIEHAWYKCYFFLCPDRFFPGWDRDRVIEEIVGRGVPCYSGSCPEVYLEKAFADTDWRPEERLPVARKLGDRSLMFLIHPSLTAKEIEKTCTVLVDVMKISCR